MALSNMSLSTEEMCPYQEITRRDVPRLAALSTPVLLTSNTFPPEPGVWCRHQLTIASTEAVKHQMILFNDIVRVPLSSMDFTIE